MKWKCVLMVVLLQQCVSARDIVLIDFDTDLLDSTVVWLDHLEEKGLIATLVFPPDKAIAVAHGVPAGWFGGQSDNYSIYLPEDIAKNASLVDDASVTAIFMHLSSLGARSADRSDLPPLSNCERTPAVEDSAGQSGLRWDATDAYTAQYAMGDFAVGVFFMESTGSQENWWPAAKQQTQNEIAEGLAWLSDRAFENGVRQRWFMFPTGDVVSTSYEPISGAAPPDWTGGDFLWLNDVWSMHFQPSGWDGAFGVANALRRSMFCNWSVQIIVVMDENDADHMFPDSVAAYVPYPSSSIRGPFTVMTYNNNGYGPSNMDYVVAHEVSHILGASDEYFDSNCNCGPGRSYLQTNNGNCQNCNQDWVPCYMISSAGANPVCSFTPPQLGYRDSDGDKIMDPIDQNSWKWTWIGPVYPQDHVRIYNSVGGFVNTFTVTYDMLLPNNKVFWNGVTHSNSIASNGYYPITVNNQPLQTVYLSSASSGSFTVSNHYFNLDTISYHNDDMSMYIRHTVYDSLGVIYAWPLYDQMTEFNTTVKADVSGYDGGNYTSEVFGWLSDGKLTNVSVIPFYIPICPDINGDGTIDVADMTYLVDYMFLGGPAPPRLNSADITCDGEIDIDDLTKLVAWLFNNGPPPLCLISQCSK